jgi:hypothetical protein
MANVYGPLMSVAATGSIAQTLCFKRGVRGTVCRRYAVPGGQATVEQESVRLFTGNLMKDWVINPQMNKDTWNELAASRNLEPINVYCQENWKRHLQGLDPTRVWPVVEAGPSVTYFVTDLLFPPTPEFWVAFSDNDSELPVELIFGQDNIGVSDPTNIVLLFNVGEENIGGSWDFSMCPNLREVILSYCAIETMPVFTDLQNMLNCDLSFNHITIAAQIDLFLITLAGETLLNGGEVSFMMGTNAPRTSDSDSAVSDLISRGWYINTNE